MGVRALNHPLDLASKMGIPSYSDLTTPPLLSKETQTFPGTIWVLMDIEPSHKDGGLKCAGFKQQQKEILRNNKRGWPVSSVS